MVSLREVLTVLPVSFEKTLFSKQNLVVKQPEGGTRIDLCESFHALGN